MSVDTRVCVNLLITAHMSSYLISDRDNRIDYVNVNELNSPWKFKLFLNNSLFNGAQLSNYRTRSLSHTKYQKIILIQNLFPYFHRYVSTLYELLYKHFL